MESIYSPDEMLEIKSAKFKLSAVIRIVAVCQFAFFTLFTLSGCCKNKKDRTISTKEEVAGKDPIGRKKLEPSNPIQNGVTTDQKKDVPAAAAQPSSVEEKVVPKEIPLDAKGQQIAKGVKRRKNDYPTMGDVNSDWDEKTDGDEKKVENNEKLPSLNQPEPISKETKEKSASQDPVSKGKEEVKAKQPVKDKSESKGKEEVKEKSSRAAPNPKDKQRAEKKKDVPAEKKKKTEPKDAPVAAVPAAKPILKITPATAVPSVEKVKKKTSDDQDKSEKKDEPKAASTKEFSFKEGKTQEESQKTESQMGPSIVSVIKNDANDASDKKDNSSKKANAGKAEDIKQSDEGEEN
uniref:Uncharacterized protein n=1 Tax=Ditylenchus dipsaci TaxID=166011 RepID=A0A915CRK9_9BILA